MLGFLQGFAYGLWLSCIPWFVVGLVKPRLAVASEPPRRWKALVRYGLVVPFLAFVLWLTSLWGGFSPTLAGWLAGLAAIAVTLPVERRWHRWRAGRATARREAEREATAAAERAALERAQREAGVAVLDPARPPAGADAVVQALAAAKQRLLDARRPDLAVQADRLYTRYAHALEVLDAKFDPREVTYTRSRELVAEVCRAAVDNLNAMASLAHGVRSIDPLYVRRRLDAHDLAHDEREALTRRLALLDDTTQRLNGLSARNEGILTALDDTAVAVARVSTERPQASVALEQAVGALRRFIDKAEAYGRGG
ncbi:cobyrinic acid a,c-diamide synthase [Ectothiorhodospiraceae bacterium 2226]|nr:cobyrinic acid a,c-diamide synthase [Ectothiorhodospiraceae bacterium 2226]